MSFLFDTKEVGGLPCSLGKGGWIRFLPLGSRKQFRSKPD